MVLRRSFLIPAGIVLAITLLCIYFYFDPSDSALFPKCSFYALTGFKCPGCGSQRAIHALLHGDIATALHMNAMMIVLLPAVVVLCTGECLRSKYPRLYLRINCQWVIWTSFVVVVGWWIVRNIINQ